MPLSETKAYVLLFMKIQSLLIHFEFSGTLLG